MINLSKLTKEMTAAGIPISGCNVDGVVWAPDGTTEIQEQPDVALIISAHDPTPTPEPLPINTQVDNLTQQVDALQTQNDLLEQTIQDLITGGI